MKLNYRDKMILAIVLAIAILIAGYFALIKPKSQDIEDHQITLSRLEEEKSEIETKIAKIPGLKTEINDTYEATNKLTKLFVPREQIDNPVKLDEFMRDFADECEVKVMRLEVSDAKVSALNYYYQKATDVGAALRAGADINGDLQAAVDAANAESTALSQRTVESVLQTSYALTINGEKDDIWNYLKAIDDNNTAILINTVNFTDYSFGEDTDSETQTTVQQSQGEGEEGEETPTPAATTTTTVSDGTSDVSIVITLYSVYNMSQPNTD